MGWMPQGFVWATDRTCVSHVLRLLPCNGIPSLGFTDGLREAAKWGRHQLRGGVCCVLAWTWKILEGHPLSGFSKHVPVFPSFRWQLRFDSTHVT